MAGGGAFTPLTKNDPVKVGSYRLIGRLGAGGMGTVYAGVDDIGRRAAVKVVHRELAGDLEFRARFAREITLLGRVRSPYTVRMLGADTGALQPWLATEYVPGPTLEQRVTDFGPLAEPETIALAAGLAEALRSLHAAGVVHRDLKPANVILSPTGPRVIDMGIARAMEETSVTRTGVLVGSPSWISPEEYRGEEIGPAADVYGWGLLVLYAATGRAPFGGGRLEVLAVRVLTETPDTGQVPGQLAALVGRALAKEPAERPSAELLLDTMIRAWRAAEETETVGIAPEAGAVRPDGTVRDPEAARESRDDGDTAAEQDGTAVQEETAQNGGAAAEAAPEPAVAQSDRADADAEAERRDGAGQESEAGQKTEGGATSAAEAAQETETSGAARSGEHPRTAPRAGNVPDAEAVPDRETAQGDAQGEASRAKGAAQGGADRVARDGRDAGTTVLAVPAGDGAAGALAVTEAVTRFIDRAWVMPSYPEPDWNVPGKRRRSTWLPALIVGVVMVAGIAVTVTAAVWGAQQMRQGTSTAQAAVPLAPDQTAAPAEPVQAAVRTESPAAASGTGKGTVTELGDGSRFVLPDGWLATRDEGMTGGMICARPMAFRDCTNGGVEISYWISMNASFDHLDNGITVAEMFGCPGGAGYIEERERRRTAYAEAEYRKYQISGCAGDTGFTASIWYFPEDKNMIKAFRVPQAQAEAIAESFDPDPGFDEVGGNAGDEPRTAQDELAREQALAIHEFLNASERTRKKLGKAIASVFACRKMGSAVKALTEVYTERYTQSEWASPSGGRLEAHAIKGGEALLAKLSAAMNASAEASGEYLQWARWLASTDCVQTYASDRHLAAGNAASERATKAKRSFVKAWNRIAKKEGLRTRRAGKI